jgi:hypothetical protein
MMCSPVRDHGPQSWHRDTGPEQDAPLPGSIPVELKAGDGVVYTNFILHWGSNYTTRLRRTIHLGYQSFGGPLYRYFHLWWELGFTQNLPLSVRAPFERWTQCIAREHDLIEGIYRAILNRDVPAFRAGLVELHPGEEGRMTCVIILCKVAQKLHRLTRPGFASLTPAEQDRVAHWRTRHLYLDVSRRFTADEIDRLCQRFGTLDARLQADEEQSVVATQSRPTNYRVYDMPVGFGVDDFIGSWAA